MRGAARYDVRMLPFASSYAALARWLGPWADDGGHPAGVRRRTVPVPPRASGDRPFEAWLYAPARRRPIGAYLIAPGLHYAGPADPRMDRFCRVLAAAGIVVLAPFLPDYTALRVRPEAVSDLDRAFDALRALPETPPGRPGIFSISFGSLLALRLAASPARAEQVGAAVIFGGYADWEATVHFCLTGEIDGRPHGRRDPLNQPVVFMNLIDALPGAPAEPAPLLAAWRAYVEATWGRQEMKEGGRHAEVARAMAANVPETLRPLFLIGCGAEPGGHALCAAALAQAAPAFLDPRPHLGDLRCPVHVIHGVDDDVIPYPQAHALAAALPPHVPRSVHVTGMYGHTGRAGIGAAPALARELYTMVRILAVMIGGATRP
jgi:pimeloyl-ACP methyl ester carboxylesterase